jgi:uncharacterized membrane protein YcaP (DUF421 family)
MAALFAIHISPWELIIRGTCVYWFLFLLFRFVLRRDAGSLGLADILLIVLIADASQNGMAGDYKTITEALILVATIAFWNYIIDWLSFRYPWFAHFAEPRAVHLVRHGRVLAENMRREMLTMEELKSQLRGHGIESVREVKHAFLEPDGQLSVIKVSARN